MLGSVVELKWGSLLLLVCLLGCAGQSHEQESVAKMPDFVPEVRSQVSVRVPMEAKLLTRAEDAFRKGDLTAPAYENAYDLFQSVLLLKPNSSQARSGIQAILIRSAERIRESTQKKNFRKSEQLLTSAQTYFPGNNLLLQLQQELNQTKARYRQLALKIPEAKPSDTNITEYRLPPYALKKRNNEMVKYLREIALRLEQTQESVMIYARTDSEGRWIYGKMKEAVPGYRVRGDIRLASQPRLELLPPLQ